MAAKAVCCSARSDGLVAGQRAQRQAHASAHRRRSVLHSKLFHLAGSANHGPHDLGGADWKGLVLGDTSMQRRTMTTAEKILIGMALVLANFRALIFIFLFPDTSVLLGPAWIEILLWILVSVVLAYFLFRDGLVHEYVSAWRKSWLLAVFVLLAFISIFW